MDGCIEAGIPNSEQMVRILPIEYRVWNSDNDVTDRDDRIHSQNDVPGNALRIELKQSVQCSQSNAHSLNVTYSGTEGLRVD